MGSITVTMSEELVYFLALAVMIYLYLELKTFIETKRIKKFWELSAKSGKEALEYMINENKNKEEK